MARSLSTHLTRGILAVALLLVPIAAQSATFTIINLDGAGEGLNDPTVVAPIGGNPGVTRGQQRMNVLIQAGGVWAALLPSTVDIRVRASFDPLGCGAGGVVLGGTSTLGMHANFAGAEFANTWYHSSLANKLAGVDLNGASDNIRIQYNSDVDSPACLGTSDWYYGYDGAEADDIDLYAVVLHELAHGLGQSGFVTLASGAQSGGLPDIYTRFLYDESLALHWPDMSNAQRQASAINTGSLVFDGFATVYKTPSFLGPALSVNVSSPPVIAGDYLASNAQFGPVVQSPFVTGAIVEVDDGVAAPDPRDLCEPIINGGAISGNIALIERGTCTFVSKVLIAQNAGAIAVIIVNNVPGAPVVMGGTEPLITIPSVMISANDGATIRSELGGGVSAGVQFHPTLRAGSHESGRPLMYAPGTLAPGSSVSHFDVSATPNLLMEPAINPDLPAGGVDLTQYVFEDEGWLPRTTNVPTPVAVSRMMLHPVSPNPFQGETTLRFDLPRSEQGELEVIDITGRVVRNLERGHLSAGQHAVTWNGLDNQGRRVSAGVYLVRLRAGKNVEARRMVFVQ